MKNNIKWKKFCEFFDDREEGEHMRYLDMLVHFTCFV